MSNIAHYTASYSWVLVSNFDFVHKSLFVPTSPVPHFFSWWPPLCVQLGHVRQVKHAVISLHAHLISRCSVQFWFMPFVDQFCFLVPTFAPVYHKILAFTLKSSNFRCPPLMQFGILRSGAHICWFKTYIITFFPYCELLCFNTQECTFTTAFESVVLKNWRFQPTLAYFNGFLLFPWIKNSVEWMCTNPEYNSVFVGCALLRVHAVRLECRIL